MHLAEAKLILNFIQKEYSHRIKNFAEWKNEFLCGALLPDTAEKQKKQISHFWEQENVDNVLVIPSLDHFLEKYIIDLEEPLICGYFAHLQLDQLFFGQFFKSQVDFLDINGHLEMKSEYVTHVFIRRNHTKVSVLDFFSEQYLYGDYTKLNPYLIEKYQVELPIFDKEMRNPISEVSIVRLEDVLEKLDTFLEQSEVAQGELMVFDRDAVDEFLQKSALAFNQFITH